MASERATAYEVLQAQVRAVEDDHRELKEVVIGTDRKIDRVAADLSKAISDGLGKLYDQLNARNRTPWGVIFAGIGVGVAILASLGSLAYAPVWASIGDMKEEAKEARTAAAKARSEFDFLRGQLSIVIPKAPQQ